MGMEYVNQESIILRHVFGTPGIARRSIIIIYFAKSMIQVLLAVAFATTSTFYQKIKFKAVFFGCNNEA